MPFVLSASSRATLSPEVSSANPSQVTFQFDRIGLQVPRFTMTVREDGTGSYQAEQAARSAGGTGQRGEAAQHIDRTMTISQAMVAKIFDAARSAGRFHTACASKAKNIADTGTKTLTYSGADGSGSCVYNYSENKPIVALTGIFLGIAYTMDEGRQLEFLHRYDRLGLDAEMNSLAQEVKEGRALELGTIAPTLHAIATDTAVIQRVQLEAARLFEQAQESR